MPYSLRKAFELAPILDTLHLSAKFVPPLVIFSRGGFYCRVTEFVTLHVSLQIQNGGSGRSNQAKRQVAIMLTFHF